MEFMVGTRRFFVLRCSLHIFSRLIFLERVYAEKKIIFVVVVFCFPRTLKKMGKPVKNHTRNTLCSLTAGFAPFLLVERRRGVVMALGVEERLGVGGRDLGHDEGADEVPLFGADGAEDLAHRAGAAAARAHAITAEVAGDTQATASVVAGGHVGAGGAAPAHQAVGDNEAVGLASGVGEKLAHRAGGAAAERDAAHRGSGRVELRLAAAGADLPALVEGTGVASPVHLVKTENAVDTAGLNLRHNNVEGHVKGRKSVSQ